MIGHREERRRRQNNRFTDYSLTPGQIVDVAEVGMDATRGLRAGGSPFGPAFMTFAGMDLAISTATAPPMQATGKFAGALTAQTAGIGAWYLGATVGKAAGAVAGAVVGGATLGPVGARVGATVGGFVGEWGTKLVAPFVLDPYLRHIGRSINRIVGAAQNRVNFGQGFQDSQQAWTMRQRSAQALRGSLAGA